MTEIVIYVLIAALLFVLGGGLGFWLGQRRGMQGAAKSSQVQEEFAAYRKQVAEHFGATAGHFQALGTQVRALYDHMAEGADTLCDAEAGGHRIEFTATAALKQPLDYEEPGDVAPVIEDDRNAAADDEAAAAGGDAAEAEARSAETTEPDAPGASDTRLQDPATDALADSATTGAANDEEAAKRAYH